MNKQQLIKEISFYHSLLWKLWFSEKSPTQDELWELHTSYDPCYCCVECGYFDTIGEKCKICGSTRKELRESREEFEIDRLKELLYISNKDELIDRLLMQERQRVIAELEKENKELKNENNEFCDYNKKLREEKQTAVKEFAEELIKMLNKYSIKRIIKICDNVLENNINLILRKRGIE